MLSKFGSGGAERWVQTGEEQHGPHHDDDKKMMTTKRGSHQEGGANLGGGSFVTEKLKKNKSFQILH